MNISLIFRRGESGGVQRRSGGSRCRGIGRRIRALRPRQAHKKLAIYRQIAALRPRCAGRKFRMRNERPGSSSGSLLLTRVRAVRSVRSRACRANGRHFLASRNFLFSLRVSDV